MGVAGAPLTPSAPSPIRSMFHDPRLMPLRQPTFRRRRRLASVGDPVTHRRGLPWIRTAQPGADQVAAQHLLDPEPTDHAGHTWPPSAMKAQRVRSLLRKPVLRVALTVGVIVVGVGLALFQPWLLQQRQPELPDPPGRRPGPVPERDHLVRPVQRLLRRRRTGRGLTAGGDATSSRPTHRSRESGCPPPPPPRAPMWPTPRPPARPPPSQTTHATGRTPRSGSVLRILASGSFLRSGLNTQERTGKEPLALSTEGGSLVPTPPPSPSRRAAPLS